MDRLPPGAPTTRRPPPPAPPAAAPTAPANPATGLTHLAGPEAAQAVRPAVALPRAFRIRTLEGSTFWVRFDQTCTWYGLPCGRLQVVGTSRLTGQKLRILGTGAVPDAGSRLAVSEQPTHVETVGEEQIKYFVEETILEVVEIPLPSRPQPHQDPSPCP